MLDVPRLDVADAVNILKIQLELVDDEALHLVGPHADVIEKDVDFRHIQGGKNIDPHFFVGKRTATDEGHDQHQCRDRAPHREDS